MSFQMMLHRYLKIIYVFYLFIHFLFSFQIWFFDHYFFCDLERKKYGKKKTMFCLFVFAILCSQQTHCKTKTHTNNTHTIKKKQMLNFHVVPIVDDRVPRIVDKIVLRQLFPSDQLCHRVTLLANCNDTVDTFQTRVVCIFPTICMYLFMFLFKLTNKKGLTKTKANKQTYHSV